MCVCLCVCVCVLHSHCTKRMNVKVKYVFALDSCDPLVKLSTASHMKILNSCKKNIMEVTYKTVSNTIENVKST